MQRFPKIVAAFNYTGPVNRLRNRLNGRILDAIRPQWLALRDAAELSEKIKIIEVAGVPGLWEYYPKVVTMRDFTPAEFSLVNSAVDATVATLQTALEDEGATNIVIDGDHFS